LKKYFERQYLGQNKLFIIIRLLMMLFCFTGYYWSENPKPVYTLIGNFRIGSYPAGDIPNSGEAFFLLGLLVLVLTLVLLFIPHLTISSDNNSLRVTRFAGKKSYVIPFEQLTHIRHVQLHNHLLLRPAFTIYPAESTRFFTGENDALELQTREGKRITIATSRPLELILFLQQQVPGIFVIGENSRSLKRP